MDFTLHTYRSLLEGFLNEGYRFQTFHDFLVSPLEKVIILRHDVDLKPENSLAAARMEHALGVQGSYYFRIIPESFRPEIIREIASLGHEVGYHYEDVDTLSRKGKSSKEKSLRNLFMVLGLRFKSISSSRFVVPNLKKGKNHESNSLTETKNKKLKTKNRESQLSDHRPSSMDHRPNTAILETRRADHRPGNGDHGHESAELLALKRSCPREYARLKSKGESRSDSVLGYEKMNHESEIKNPESTTVDRGPSTIDHRQNTTNPESLEKNVEYRTPNVEFRREENRESGTTDHESTAVDHGPSTMDHRQNTTNPEFTAVDQMIEKAFESFKTNLEKFREIVPVKTICMHGSPRSRYDNRLIWDYFDYRELGIIGEPYRDIDFDKVFYLTDTGRRWDGWKVSVRDKLPQQQEWIRKGLAFRSTSELIRAVREDLLPDQIMITVHPQRWTNSIFPWMKELIMQGIKNGVKYFIVNRP